MSNGDIRKVSRQDIQLIRPPPERYSEDTLIFKVQNLIEQCLLLYMSKKEVVNALFVQEKIEPKITELVWQKLEEENQEFFQAYYLRLLVKEQIMEFNNLLARQVELKHQVGRAGVAFMPMSNGSHIQPKYQNSACYAPENIGPVLKTENMHQSIITSLPNTFTMQTAGDMSANSRRINVSPHMVLAQSSNVVPMQGMNGRIIKTEGGYAGDSQFVFGVNGNVLDTRNAIGDASSSSFNSLESTSQPLNEGLLDADTSSFGFLGQMTRNFSLSDLTADFSNSFDIMESYSRSSFLATDGFSGENERLDNISEGLNYEDFGSD